MVGQHLLDDVVAFLEDGELLGLLLQVFFALEGGQQNLLADAWGVADVSADHARGLVFQGLQLGLCGALETKAHEPDAETPHVVFLGGAVQLHGQQVLACVQHLAEQGLLGHAVLIDQSKVGVVQQGHHLVARVGAVREDLRDFYRFLFGGGIARGVVGEVQQNHLLLALALGKGLFQGFRVETAVLEGVEGLDLRAAAVHEHQFVVVPVKVGDNHLVARIQEKVARAADGVGQGAGHNRVAEGLACEARVLADNLFFPGLAQVGVSETGGVEEGLLGQVQALEHAVENQGATVVFQGGADGGVDFFALGFGALAQNALAGEEDGLAPFGKHGKYAAAVCGKFRVGLFCERIVAHDLGPVKKFRGQR